MLRHSFALCNIRRILCGLACGAALIGAAGCGGTSSSSSGSGSQSILTIGTINYIDSLNPFVAYDAQAYNAFCMEYPQLVQYGPGLKLQGDWAKSWTHSANGLIWTFHLIAGGKWSDGVPLTSKDAAWTINTILKYKSGATSLGAYVLDGVKDATAPNPTTLVIHYGRPVAPALANLEQMFILPEHVWSHYTGNHGKDLTAFYPDQHLPVVSGGPYEVTKYEEKGTTVFKPNPYFYGPKSQVAAIALTYYTNPTSMIADFEAGNADFIDDVPYTAADSLKGKAGITLSSEIGEEVTNLGFNSNPLKPRNRELLNPMVKEALEYAIPRQQLVSVLFAGYAHPWANIMSAWSKPSGWINPAVKPLPYDPAKANQILDSLGYKPGSGGIRDVPPTGGRFPQGAHQMSYGVVVPNDLDFNGDRQFEILQAAFQKVGVKINEIPGGDVSQAYTTITAPHGTYQNTDMYTWYWHPYIDPNFNLSVVTRAQWNDNSDTGMNDPTYDAMWEQQQRTVNVPARRRLVWKMEAYLARKRPYIQLVNNDLLTAHRSGWTGFYPQLWSYCKCYYTNVRPTS